MKSKKIAVIAVLLLNLFCYAQGQVVELPLTTHTGYGQFTGWGSSVSLNVDGKDNPWENTYLKISNPPEGLTDIKFGHVETNFFQSVYQDYLLGKITKDWYEELQKKWDWTPDILNLSKTPMKTKIAFAYGKDSDGILKMVVDVNNNLDLSDDKVFAPYHFEMATEDSLDSLAKIYAMDASFEIFLHDKITPVTIPLFISWVNILNMPICHFSQYLTTQFEGEQIAIYEHSFSDVTYSGMRLAFVNDLTAGEKVKYEDLYKKSDFIEIKDAIYKIIGVNTNKNTLILEKSNLAKAQITSTQIGYKPYPFKGKDFATGKTVSLERLKGKYVLLDFWGTWCAPCIKEFPHLKELYAKTDRVKFEIVGIVSDSPANALTNAIDMHKLAWPQILSDDANPIAKKYEVNSFPTTILIN